MWGAPVPSTSTNLFACAAPVPSLQVPLPHSHAHWLKSPALASGHVIVVVVGCTPAAEALQRHSDFEGQKNTRVLSENRLSTHNLHRPQSVEANLRRGVDMGTDMNVCTSGGRAPAGALLQMVDVLRARRPLSDTGAK